MKICKSVERGIGPVVSSKQGLADYCQGQGQPQGDAGNRGLPRIFASPGAMTSATWHFGSALR